ATRSIICHTLGVSCGRMVNAFSSLMLVFLYGVTALSNNHREHLIVAQSESPPYRTFRAGADARYAFLIFKVREIRQRPSGVATVFQNGHYFLVADAGECGQNPL